MERSLHESDDQLELYALDRLDDTAVERIEEHLIICGRCRSRLEDAGLFARAIQQALRNPAPLEMPRRLGWFEGWHLRFALGGALAFALLLGVLAYRNASHVSLPPVATLTLSAMRGDSPAVSPAKELDLTLLGATVAPLNVELVDASGQGVWSGPAEIRNETAHVRVARALSPGTYFARLRTPAGELLHEYGFEVRR